MWLLLVHTDPALDTLPTGFALVEARVILD